MPPPPLNEWHEFFTVLGGAAAALIGAMFVVVSIGVGMLSVDRGGAIRAFISATVSHLSTALFASLVVMVPGLDWLWLGVIIGLAGIAGLAYAARVVTGFRQHDGTVGSDWFWYAIVPPLGYAAFLVAGVTAVLRVAWSLDLLAAAALLLAVGIRNGWDMIVFLVTRDRSST